MDVEPRNAGREEVERLPADDSDLENGSSGRGNTAGGMDDGGRTSSLHPCGINEADSFVAHSNRLSSPMSSDPEKREDMEIVDWDGPNDPGNP
jgi:hypothetical protein